ncbi:MAG TPA: hypothetical protein VKK31_24810 [Thermoanaerobaculia bacterium]|nr:hypothetical protein [Thermoanaerobaculia bacterium]
MVAASNAARGRVRVTIYPDAGHDAWSRTYDDPAFLDLVAGAEPRQSMSAIDGEQEMAEYATVGRYMSLTETHAVHAILESAGLSPRTLDENIAGLNWLYIPAMAGVRLEVPIEQLEEARELLAARIEPGEQDSAEDQTYFRKAKRNRRILGYVALFLFYPLLAVISALLVWASRSRHDDRSIT